jgi:hypothetical protein
VATAFKDLGLDATDPWAVGRFWADALGQELRRLDDGGTSVHGERFLPIRVQRVPEPKSVKNRVHLDLYVPDVAALVALGATVLARHDGWSVLGDPEGNELCAFPPERLVEVPAAAFAICVDSAEPVELAAWWQDRLGGAMGPGSDGRPRWLHEARGLDHVTLKFVPVDDERVVANRCHWDVTADAIDVEALIAAGATVLRSDGDAGATVLADPQGNEFRAVEPPAD